MLSTVLSRPRVGLAAALTLAATAVPFVSPTAHADPAPACLTGSFTWTDPDHRARPASYWKADLIDAVTRDVLDTGYVSPQGTYRLCGTADAGGRQVKVTFRPDGEHWTVRWSFSTVAFDSPATTLAAPSTALDVALTDIRLYSGVAEVFDDVRRAWEAVPGPCWDQEGTCSKINVVWDTTQAVHPHYSLGSKVITVGQDSFRPAHVLVHESMHAIMDDVYDYAFPPYRCAIVSHGQTYEGIHGPGALTTPGCAWVEGIADWFAATVMGDGVMRLSADDPGSSVETVPYQQHGDSVEGWVTAALNDLVDTSDEDGDEVAEGIAPTWTVLQEARPATFADYWKARGDLGFDTSFKAWRTLAHDTIDYPKPACEATLGTVNSWGTPQTNWFATVTVRAGDEPLHGWSVRTRLAAGARASLGFDAGVATSGAVTTVTSEAVSAEVASGATRDVVVMGVGPVPANLSFSCSAA